MTEAILALYIFYKIFKTPNIVITDNSPATFDTPEMDRPYSPSTSTARENRSETVDSSREKPKDLIDNHTLGMCFFYDCSQLSQIKLVININTKHVILAQMCIKILLLQMYVSIKLNM